MTVYVNNSAKTQVATTGGTYHKSGSYLRPLLFPGAKIISIGAGLDHTKPALKAGFGGSVTVHDMEPNPAGRKHPPEFTSSDQIPAHHYDAAVCHNVLNVVEPHVRDMVMHSIFRSLKPGGHAVIGTRKWKGDIDKAKNFVPGKEPKSMWVIKGKEKSYQRGFDGDELRHYVEGYANAHGHKVKVTKLGHIAANGIHVQLF